MICSTNNRFHQKRTRNGIVTLPHCFLKHLRAYLTHLYRFRDRRDEGKCHAGGAGQWNRPAGLPFAPSAESATRHPNLSNSLLPVQTGSGRGGGEGCPLRVPDRARRPQPPTGPDHSAGGRDLQVCVRFPRFRPGRSISTVGLGIRRWRVWALLSRSTSLPVSCPVIVISSCWTSAASATRSHHWTARNLPRWQTRRFCKSYAPATTAWYGLGST